MHERVDSVQQKEPYNPNNSGIARRGRAPIL